MPDFFFRSSMCFQFSSKTFTKRFTNNSLLSRDKTISSLLELICQVFSISEYVLEKHNCFRFWWKTYTNRWASNYVRSRVKRLSSPALCSWSGAFSFWVWFGKRNMTVKIPILILFCFCLLKIHLFCVVSVVAANCFNYIGPWRWF